MLSTLYVLLYVYFLFSYTNGETTQASEDVNQINSLTEIGYEFILETRSLYKYHSTPKKFSDAKAICENEGASLFYPDTENEFNVITSFLTNKYKETLAKELLLGIEKSAKGFETIDGIPATKVYMKWRSGEPNNAGNENCVIFLNPSWEMNDVPCNIEYKFICKSRMNEWNEQCLVPSLDYGYSEELGKCYKFHLTPRTWSQAQETCRAEQSQLAVINSHEEAAYFVRLTRSTLRYVPGRFTHGVVLLGFHNNNVDDWQTVNGTSLYYSGYACWGNSQPDGGEQARCGSMFYNGHLNDISCDQKAFFICEHDIEAFNYVHEPRSFYNVIQAVRCYDTI